MDSRVKGTRNLVKGFETAGAEAPTVLVMASAIGFYGDRGDDWVSEDSDAGRGFLAEVCRKWETEGEKAATARTRVALLRLGVVIGEGGGALEKMGPLFSRSMGAKLGTGKQWMSWVHLDDVVGAFCFALQNDKVSGPLNLVAPEPVTNEEFTQTLAATFKKSNWLTAPAGVIRLALGEMATALLDSCRTLPQRLESFGFRFTYPKLKVALTQIYRDYPNHVFETAQFVNKPITEVFHFFSQAQNLETITPPTLSFNIVGQSTDTLGTGTEIDYKLRVHGVPLRWKTRIEDWNENRSFADNQIQGPYAHWYHTHEFEALRGGTLMKDRVSYRLPMGGLGELVGGPFVKNDVGNIFSFRRKKISEIFG